MGPARRAAAVALALGTLALVAAPASAALPREVTETPIDSEAPVKVVRDASVGSSRDR